MTTHANILAAIDAGATVTFSNMLRAYQFSPKLVAKLRTAGCEPFKVGKSGSLLMYSGYSAKTGAKYVEIVSPSGIAHGRIAFA